MLLHNLLLILRNFQRSKSLFFINLAGLTLGITSVLLIYLWIADEMSVDRGFENGDRLFEVMLNAKSETGIQTMENTPGLLANALVAEIPEIEAAACVIPSTFNISKGTVSIKDSRIKVSGQYVSPDFLNIFSYKLLAGKRDNILTDPKSIVITERLAAQLFPSSGAAIGQVIEWNAQEIKALCTISGVIETPQVTATTQFDFLLPYALFNDVQPSDTWGNSSPYTYVLLKSGIAANLVNGKIHDFIHKHDANASATLFIQRYSDRYLHGQYENGKPSGGRIAYVRLFSIIGALILFIACINFINLSIYGHGIPLTCCSYTDC
jgi:putative ABC transport system permease protein